MSNIFKTVSGEMVNVDVSRAAFTVESSDSKRWPKAVQKAARYASVELAKRNLDRKRDYVLTIGVTENLGNIRDLGRLSDAVVIPEELVLITRDKKGNVSSRRVFRELQFQFSSNGYAVFAENEVPVVKLIYDCVLESAEYMQVELE